MSSPTSHPILGNIFLVNYLFNDSTLDNWKTFSKKDFHFFLMKWGEWGCVQFSLCSRLGATARNIRWWVIPLFSKNSAENMRWSYSWRIVSSLFGCVRSSSSDADCLRTIKCGTANCKTEKLHIDNFAIPCGYTMVHMGAWVHKGTGAVCISASLHGRPPTHGHCTFAVHIYKYIY